MTYITGESGPERFGKPSLFRRAARKWGRRLYRWGSVANSTHPTAIVYVVDFTTNTNTSTNAATTGATTFHLPNPN